MKLKHSIKNILFIVMCIIIGTSIGLIGNKLLNNKNNSTKIIDKHDNYSNSIGLIFTRNNYKLQNQYDLELDSNSDFNYDLNIVSDFKDTKKIVITALIDYKQISFNLKDNNQNVDSHKFFLKPSEKYILPMRFSTNGISDGLHSMIFNISIYNQNSKENLNSSNFLVYRNLIVGKNENRNISLKAEQISHPIVEKGYLGAILNGTITREKIKYNNSTITAKPGEQIKLPLTIGGYKNINKYIFWVTLNDNQYPFDNKQFCYFDVSSEKFAKKQINIIAPKAKGEYIISICMVTNPFEKLTKYTVSKIHEDYSNKIKLVVAN